MKTTMINNFRCECCGTTEPLFDEEITVTLIGTNGVIEKIVCYECANKIKNDDPRYLDKSVRHLDPNLQRIVDNHMMQWNEHYNEYKNEFFAHTKVQNKVMEKHGNRNFTGFVDVTDPCYGSGGYSGYDGKRLPIATGNYSCISWKMNLVTSYDGENFEHTEPIAIGIYLNDKIPNREEMIHACNVGVDAGVIGIFDVKDDFELRYWFEDKLANEDYMTDVQVQDVGFTASVNDGGYKIYVAIENGEITAVEIRVSGYVDRE